MKQERYKWIKVDQHKVLLDTICNEIVSEIGEVDEIIAFDDLGTEAIYKYEVENLPLTVEI